VFTVGAGLVFTHFLHRATPPAQAGFRRREQPRLVGVRVPQKRQPLRAAEPPAAARRRRCWRRQGLAAVEVRTWRALGAGREVERVRVQLELDRRQHAFFVHQARVRLQPAVGRRRPRQLGLLRGQVPANARRRGMTKPQQRIRRCPFPLPRQFAQA